MYIKKLTFIICLSFLAISFSQNDNDWLTNYEQVVSKSIKEKKPVMVNFTGSDWCGWCKKLKRAVFDTEVFKAWAEKNVILLELDYPRRTFQSEKLKKQNAQLQQTFRQFVRGYPTVLIFEVNRTFKDDGSKDRDNIMLLPNNQIAMTPAGRLGFMPNPNQFIEQANDIINGKE